MSMFGKDQTNVELVQSPVFFDEEEHRYWLDGKELQGVTSTLVQRAFPHTYDGIDEDVLKRAAERGTAVHKAIEAYEVGGEYDAPDELLNYIIMKDRQGLQCVANEYIVSDGKCYASAIDLVMEDREGGIVLADIKTTYEKHYDRVACQLSIYKRFFEMQNPGLKVARIALIWLRGDKSEWRELEPWSDADLDALMEADKAGEAFDLATTYGDFPTLFAKVEDEVADIMLQVKALQERDKALRQGLYEQMVAHNVKKYSGGRLTLSVVLPTEAATFDSKAFKADHPEIYEQYVKKTQKAGSLRITVKG